MGMRWLLGVVLLPVVLAGCADPTYQVTGTFTSDRTEADIEDLRLLAQEHGGDVLIAESFPEQFVISDVSRHECEELRGVLLEKDYLANVDTCSARDAGAY